VLCKLRTPVHLNIIKDIPSGHAYIAPYNKNGGGWVVTLPKSLDIKPRQKYFNPPPTGVGRAFFRECSRAGVQYRDSQLSAALKNHGISFLIIFYTNPLPPASFFTLKFYTPYGVLLAPPLITTCSIFMRWNWWLALLRPPLGGEGGGRKG